MLVQMVSVVPSLAWCWLEARNITFIVFNYMLCIPNIFRICIMKRCCNCCLSKPFLHLFRWSCDSVLKSILFLVLGVFCLFVFLFFVLELYYRKAGGKREGRKRERGWPWPRGEREGGLERKVEKGESLKRARRGQAAPFVVGWTILLLSGNYGEEHIWL